MPAPDRGADRTEHRGQPAGRLRLGGGLPAGRGRRRRCAPRHALPTDCLPPPDRTPDRPPASDHDWRSAAPEAVPGSTKASSRNSTSGQSAPIAIMTQPTTAIPPPGAVESPLPGR